MPIPSTHSCKVDQAGGCWFRVQAAFPSGTPQDVTTWTASIDGDPIRQIQ